MTVCERVFEDLKAYQDGELGWGASWTVRRHLAACPGCRKELEELTTLQTRIRRADAGELPPALRARILAAYAEMEPARVRNSASRRVFTQPRLAWGTVALAGILAVAVLSGPMSTWWRPAGDMSAAKGPGEAPAAAGPPGAAGAVPQMFKDSGSARMNKSLARSRENGQARSRNAVSGSAAPGKPHAYSLAVPAPIVGTKGPRQVMSARAVPAPKGNAPAAAAPYGLSFGSQVRPNPSASDGGSLGKTIHPISPQFSYDAAKLQAPLADQKPSVELLLMVDNVAERSANIKAAAKSLGGEVAPTALGFVAANAENLTIDVPADKLKETVAEIKKQGDVVAKVLPEAESLAGLSRQVNPVEQTPALSTGIDTRAPVRRDEKKENSKQATDGLNSAARNARGRSQNVNAQRADLLSEPRGAAGPATEFRANKPAGGREPERSGNNTAPAQNGAGRSGGQGVPGGLGLGGSGGGGFGGGNGGGGGAQAKQEAQGGAAMRNVPPAQPTRGKKDDARRFQDREEKTVQLGGRSARQAPGREKNGQVRDLPQTPPVTQLEQLKQQSDKQQSSKEPQARYYVQQDVNRDRSNHRNAYARITIKLRQKQNPALDAGKKP